MSFQKVNGFQFKQFALEIFEGVFPVTTDSVLLGSWCAVKQVNKILDIGCGCGILSLMLAQRTNPEVVIHALDIDQASVACCNANIAASSWHDRVHCFQGNVIDMITQPEYQSLQSSYDLIVSNPPYFNNQLLASTESGKRQKHQHEFDFSALAKSCNYVLNEHGRAAFVIPHDLEESLNYEMYLHSFIKTKATYVKHKFSAPISLVLMEYSLNASEYARTELILYDEGNNRTEEYHKLTEGFYLREQLLE